VGAGRVVVSHPTGNANVSAVVNALMEEDLLAAFFTCIVWRPESALAKVVPRQIRSIFERRARVQIPEHLVHTRPFSEVMRNLYLKAGKKHLIADSRHRFSTAGVYRDLDAYVARSLRQFPDAKAVFAYEDGALQEFREAKAQGMRCIYDLPIGYWRANRTISLEEAELQPEWRGTLNSLSDSDEKCALKDQELELADVVMTPSTFVRDTLDMYPGRSAAKKVYVHPFGVPANISAPRELTHRDQPLRVLYVGALTQRKGISYLFEAIEKMGKAATLTIIGRKVGNTEILDKCCAAHRWIPSLPHREVLAEMSRHDVFVFPSLFEGLALVQGEAISQGLPVITTPNSGGADILRDGIDGFIVPIRHADAIASHLIALHQDRELLKTMSDSARERAAELNWATYKARTVQAVREVLNS
jgi:starch synthase